MELNDEQVLDAVGNPIIFGRDYGYIVENSGVTGVRIGTPESITPKGYVTILVRRVVTQYGVNGKRTSRTEEEGFERTSVKPIKLFPI